MLGILCKAPTSATNPSFVSPIENFVSFVDKRMSHADIMLVAPPMQKPCARAITGTLEFAIVVKEPCMSSINFIVFLLSSAVDERFSFKFMSPMNVAMSIPAEKESPFPSKRMHLASSFSFISFTRSGIPNQTSKSIAFFFSGLLIHI